MRKSLPAKMSIGEKEGICSPGLSGSGIETDGFEDGEGVVGSGVNLDALVCVARVFEVKRMKVVLLGERVELWVVGVVELIPGHGISLVCDSTPEIGCSRPSYCGLRL